MLKKEIAVILAVCLFLGGCSGKANDHVPAPTEGNIDSYLLVDEDPQVIPSSETQTEPSTDPVTEPTMEETTIPETEETKVPEVVITKDPTSEAVFPGGRTWFIAHADNDTMITWEIFSPDGTMYSVDEAMDMHPGLVLDILPEDTLGLRDIPASFNGWSARARFDGPGGTAVTERAKITIRDPYEQIIENYRKVWKGEEMYWKLGVSEFATIAEYIGHTTLDLDGNGIRELMIFVVGAHYDGVVCEIYTLQNGEAVNIKQSWSRSRSYLLTDGRIYTEGSNGAAYQIYHVGFVNGASLTISETIYTMEEKNGLDDPVPHYYYSNLSRQGEPMYSEEAYAMLDDWRSRIWIPELTYIS